MAVASRWWEPVLGISSNFKFGAIHDDAAAWAPSRLNGDGATVAGFSKNNPGAAGFSPELPRMVPPRKRKMVQSAPVTETFSIGNCIVEFPSDADQEITAEKLSLQVNQFASVKISVDKSKTSVPEKPSPRAAGQSLPSDVSFQLINPKSVDKINSELLESTIQLYKQELPAMNFAADTGKESDFLRNCTMSGKYCSLLLKKPGESPADPEIVVGAITYQILPTSTQYAEIPLAAIDQSCQRQGLGKLLVGELARRLMDVGVLTLFCWGDQESEKFWNKQGFLKIAEVNAQGKPQKLRLKNEIRKAMSLPGSSALMVCNLPHLNTSTSTSVGWNTHQTPGPKNVTTTIEKELAEQSPIAHSDVLDPYSFENIPFKTPLSSEVSPASAAPLPSCPVGDGAKSKGRKSSSRLSVMANPTPGSAFSPEKSIRTLRFADIDRVALVEKEVSGSPTTVYPGHLVSTVAREESGPAVKPCTERLGEEKVSLAVTIDIPSNIDVGFREPLGNVQNVSVEDVVAPVKKRPRRRTQCDNPKATTAIVGPESADTGCGPGKENKELAREDVSGVECDGTVDSLKSRRKRPRAESLPEKTPGTKSVRRPRRDSPSIVNPVLKTSDPQLLDYASISEKVVTPQKAGATNPVFQAPELRVPEPSSFSEHVPPAGKGGAANPVIQTPEQKSVSNSEQVVTTQKAGTVKHVAVLNWLTGSDTRDARAVDCLQSMAHESISPSSLGEQHMNFRSQKQGKDSTIRKRLSTRLVHVPEVGEYSPLTSGFIKDFAKATPPVVFIMNMPNDPKKKALAQFGQLVEKLGGKVTGDGGECTHVIANEVRRTLNFCTALCKGAWIVTPDWLKASNRHKSFVEEESYLLRDKQFESKYKVSLATAIEAAQRKPRSLFAGFSVYPTPHVQPPLEIVTKLTKVAGGKVLSSLDEALQQNDPSRTIVLTSDEDKKEGDVATKAGLRTFKGEWLMQTIVKQRIDFDTVIPSDH